MFGFEFSLKLFVLLKIVEEKSNDCDPISVLAGIEFTTFEVRLLLLVRGLLIRFITSVAPGTNETGTVSMGVTLKPL